jgi:hypothetical protein
MRKTFVIVFAGVLMLTLACPIVMALDRINIVITTSDGMPLRFEDAFPGQTTNSVNNLKIIQPQYSAASLYIVGDNFIDTIHSGARCPTINSLGIENFEFRAKTGTFEENEWKPIPLYDNNLQNAVPLLPNIPHDAPFNDVEVQFRLTYPVPCMGLFNSGKFYIIAKNLYWDGSTEVKVYSYNFEIPPIPIIKNVIVTKNLINLNFTWERVTYNDPVKYHFQLSDSNNFENLLIDNVTENNYYDVNNLDASKTYYARVQTIRDIAYNGNSAWSEIYAYNDTPEVKYICNVGTYEDGYCIYRPAVRFICDDENATYNADTGYCEIAIPSEPVCIEQLEGLKNETQAIKEKVDYLEGFFIAINNTVTRLFENKEITTTTISNDNPVGVSGSSGSFAGSGMPSIITTDTANTDITTEQHQESNSSYNSTIPTDNNDNILEEQIQGLKKENEGLKNRVNYLEYLIKSLIEFLKSLNIDIVKILDLGGERT